MSNEPTHGCSPDPSDRGALQERSADPLPEQAEKAADEKGSWWRNWKTRTNRILPPRPPEPEDRLTSPVPGIVLFLFLLGLAALSIFLIRPPAPLPAGAPADQYSATRAMRHMQALAARPRPIGSPAHAEAQAYLFAQLEQLGLQPQVQKAVAVRDQMVAPVENVLARLPGSGSGERAVLLMAHYDSVPTGPGASDDASGCATLLETARALQASERPLSNDVILLFSDGEESGLMGAQTFVDEHPWAKDVGLVLSLDPAGLIGYPNDVFDIGPNDDWLIAQLAQADLDPMASSLASEANGRGLFTCDFAPFEAAGYPGFAIGSIHDGGYHTVLDDPAHVHLDSLQHQGSYAISVARHFGGLDLTAAHDGDAEYFNVLGTHLLVHYPQRWIYPLLVLAGLVWIGALVFGLRWEQVSRRGVLLGTLASLLVTAILAGAGFLLWRVVVAIYPQYETGYLGGDTYNAYNSLYYWLAFMALGSGLAALLHSGLRTRIRAAELALGALLLWLALAVGISIWMPGASFMPTWSLLFGSIAVWGWFALRRHGSATPWSIGWLALFAVPALVFAVSVLYGGAQGLSMPLLLVLMAIPGLLAGLLAPHLAIIARPYKWWLPILMGVIAVGLLVAGHLTSAYTPERPLQDGVVYGLNADKGEAYWLGWSGPDAWTRQFFEEGDSGGDYSEFFPEGPAPYKAPAPLADLPAPTVEELDAPTNGVFHLRVVPPPGAWTTHVMTMPWKTPVTYYVDDRPIEAKDGWMLYWAPPAEGYDLTVKAPGLESLELRVVAHTLGLPTVPGFTLVARPDWIIPSAESSDNSTWVVKTFSFRKE